MDPHGPHRTGAIVTRPLAFVFEPDARRGNTLADILAGAGCAVEHVHSLATAADAISHRHPSLLVVAVEQTSADEVIAGVARLRATDRRLPIFVIAQQSSESLAVSALRAG